MPTLKEAGIDVEADAWNGLIAPGATPKPVIDKISKDVADIIMQAGVREKLAAQLMEPIGSNSAGTARPDGQRDRTLGTGDQGGKCESELSRLVLHVLDVSEFDPRRALPRVIEDELVARHEDFVLIEIFRAT